jgi:hypothetical protein
VTEGYRGELHRNHRQARDDETFLAIPDELFDGGFG